MFEDALDLFQVNGKFTVAGNMVTARTMTRVNQATGVMSQPASRNVTITALCTAVRGEVSASGKLKVNRPFVQTFCIEKDSYMDAF